MAYPRKIHFPRKKIDGHYIFMCGNEVNSTPISANENMMTYNIDEVTCKKCLLVIRRELKDNDRVNIQDRHKIEIE